jgi:hypothetical protein
MESEIPTIRRLADVGDAPFQFIQKLESILQGWDAKIRKNIYLFKTDSGGWGYYDKNINTVSEVSQWKGKSALVGDHFVKMALYHRIQVKFLFPLTYNSWDKAAKKEVPAETENATLAVTDKTYKQILDQLKGRAADSNLRFNFVTRKIQDRQSTYIDSVVWES